MSVGRAVRWLEVGVSTHVQECLVVVSQRATLWSSTSAGSSKGRYRDRLPQALALTDLPSLNHSTHRSRATWN